MTEQHYQPFLPTRIGAFAKWVLGTALTAGLILTASLGSALAGSDGPVTRVFKLPQASLVAEERGREVVSHNPDRAMVPASTMKILTALAAIERWGLNHRFRTDFHLGDDNRLWVKGYGDPYLVSEELERIAAALKARGIRKLSGIGTDDSYFDPGVEVSGRSSSSNPYDAPVTALAANFNTVNVVNRGGSVRTAEPQTPLTPLARQFGQRLGAGKHRVNLRQRDKAVRYFGEILSAKLEQAGIAVSGEPRNGRVPASAKRIYRHENSRDLRTVVDAMLEYSNNFIANGLFIKLADRGDGRPLRMIDAQRTVEGWARATYDWRGHRIEDGAGLSRGNRLSARQLVDAVKSFTPYIGLLPEQNRRVKAKTGTLRGVSCYAGFVKRDGRWEPFSLLINQSVSHNFRLQVADALATAPNLAGLCPGGSC